MNHPRATEQGQPLGRYRAAFAGLAVGTGIAGLIAWHMGTLHYFVGGF